MFQTVINYFCAFFSNVAWHVLSWSNWVCSWDSYFCASATEKCIWSGTGVRRESSGPLRVVWYFPDIWRKFFGSCPIWQFLCRRRSISRFAYWLLTKFGELTCNWSLWKNIFFGTPLETHPTFQSQVVLLWIEMKRIRSFVWIFGTKHSFPEMRKWRNECVPGTVWMRRPWPPLF